ncbi:MAG: hypothetical protein R6V50_03095 [Thermoplasmatota archaeon]
MTSDLSHMINFTSITLSDPFINKNNLQTTITLTTLEGQQKKFTLMHSYPCTLETQDRTLLRLACCMPLLNYALFSKTIQLDFPLSQTDLNLLNRLNTIFSRDIYVNKILRRRTNYILPEYLPPTDTTSKDRQVSPARIMAKKRCEEYVLSKNLNSNRCGVLSSGGKESLLTYALLNEIGSDVYPFYINESGGHWRTALPAYRYHSQTQPHTRRVWSNVDRFYNFMLDNLFFIRKDHRNIQADTYPLRLCIFPFYIFSVLPLFIKYQIGNLLLGSEFDDIQTQPTYQGIPHYYGIYDQHQDYDNLMNEWYNHKIPGLVQWSAVRNISGLIVQRILVKRYPHLATHQRSCHSCHITQNQILPCGHCSKCRGVLLFLLANKDDPTVMSFQSQNAEDFIKQTNPSLLRLDEDEKTHSFYLIQHHTQTKYQPVDHVEQIHHHKQICDACAIPDQFRNKLFSLFEQYTKGYCFLENDSWKTVEKNIKELDIFLGC